MQSWKRAGAKLKTASLLGVGLSVDARAVAQSRGDGGSGWFEGSSAARTNLGAELAGPVSDFHVPKDQGSLCLTLNEGACPATGVRLTVIEYMPRFASGAAGPAEEAGLRTGDVLLNVAGRSVLGAPLNDVLDVLRAAPIDQQVHFRVLRPADGQKKAKGSSKLFGRSKAQGKAAGDLMPVPLQRIDGALGMALGDGVCPVSGARQTAVRALPKAQGGGAGAAERGGVQRFDCLLTVGATVVAGMAARDAERQLQPDGAAEDAAATSAVVVRVFRPISKRRSQALDETTLVGNGATPSADGGSKPATTNSGGWRMVKGIQKALGLGSLSGLGPKKNKKAKKLADAQNKEAVKSLRFEGMQEAALAAADPRAAVAQAAIERRESAVLRVFARTEGDEVAEDDDSADVEEEGDDGTECVSLGTALLVLRFVLRAQRSFRTRRREEAAQRAEQAVPRTSPPPLLPPRPPKALPLPRVSAAATMSASPEPQLSRGQAPPTDRPSPLSSPSTAASPQPRRQSRLRRLSTLQAKLAKGVRTSPAASPAASPVTSPAASPRQTTRRMSGLPRHPAAAAAASVTASTGAGDASGRGHSPQPAPTRTSGAPSSTASQGSVHTSRTKAAMLAASDGGQAKREIEAARRAREARATAAAGKKRADEEAAAAAKQRAEEEREAAAAAAKIRAKAAAAAKAVAEEKREQDALLAAEAEKAAHAARVAAATQAAGDAAVAAAAAAVAAIASAADAAAAAAAAAEKQQAAEMRARLEMEARVRKEVEESLRREAQEVREKELEQKRQAEEAEAKRTLRHAEVEAKRAAVQQEELEQAAAQAAQAASLRAELKRELAAEMRQELKLEMGAYSSPGGEQFREGLRQRLQEEAEAEARKMLGAGPAISPAKHTAMQSAEGSAGTRVPLASPPKPSPVPLPTDRQLRAVHQVREEAVARAWAEAEATVEFARRQAQARVDAAKALFEVRFTQSKS